MESVSSGVGFVLATGVVSSVFATAIVFAWQRILRPKIDISTMIALSPSTEGGVDIPRIKLINRKWREAYDLRVGIYFRWDRTHKSPTKSKKDTDTLHVFKKVGEVRVYDSLPGKRLDGKFDNCRRVRLQTSGSPSLYDQWKEMREKVNSDVIVVVRVTAEDSWSRVRRSASREFVSWDASTLRGDFVVGNSFEIAAAAPSAAAPRAAAKRN